MKFKTALAAVAAMTLTGTAYAQVGPEVGATVYEAPNGEIGGVIGTIETIEKRHRARRCRRDGRSASAGRFR